jgi:hypothetical protein
MKKVAYLLTAVLIPVVFTVTGCNPSPEVPGEEMSTCVTCHSDEDMLQQTASAEVEKVSEETSGEG